MIKSTNPSLTCSQNPIRLGISKKSRQQQVVSQSKTLANTDKNHLETSGTNKKTKKPSAKFSINTV
jgi:hypothetical protein